MITTWTVAIFALHASEFSRRVARNTVLVLPAVMLVGAVAYGGAGYLLLRWATAARSMEATPPTEPPVP